ncbi:MAG: ATP-dependent helicase HrpB [Gorillibacterium sp.]|nr:ATP-dependent helicase HrpB [Gorillibacterium sp.]
MRELPIDSVLPELQETLRQQVNAVLTAPPGAGKTTRVPLSLLEESWLAKRKIIMLEPRRIAARSVARYMALLLGEQVGQTVGYRVRADTRIGPTTRIEVVTEGVLTRLLQEDPALSDVGVVIFDEFHERSLHADLGLALCLQAQSLLRDDLRLLIMSATLEIAAVSELLGNAPVVASEGRSYPVETRYSNRRIDGPIEPAVVATIQAALEQEAGDILVFLPGAAEIRRVQTRLAAVVRGKRVQVAPLYGDLSQAEQDRALQSALAGERKIVLATSIAETSLTVEGVRVVVDSGLMRVPCFSPRTGMTRLETVPVSRSSADQRRGRAGRVAAGVCYRLWLEQEDGKLAARSVPEILEAELAPLALELAVWGVQDPAELAWLDAPPDGALAQARQLLRLLGALDDAHVVTPQGRRMAALGLHPRLARMLLEAARRGMGALACELAALLGERDLLRSVPGGAALDADLRVRVKLLRGGSPAAGAAGAADPAALRRIATEAAWLRRGLGVPSEAADAAAGEEASGLLLAFAYPDRIAVRREDGRFLLASGRGAVLPSGQELSAARYLVAAELDDQGVDSRIYLAAPVELSDLELHAPELFREETAVEWDAASGAVRARRRRRLGALLLLETPLQKPDLERVRLALLAGIAEEGLTILPWSRTSQQLLERIHFMHRWIPEYPELSAESLLQTLADWLGPHLVGMKNRQDLNRLNLTHVLEEALTWTERRQLDEWAPTHITVPSGSRIPIDYSDPDAPVLAVRLQEMFGLTDTPRIAGDRVPLVLHLLSPAQRPMQVTRDLASFWRDTYYDVRKDLKGRYPKHDWPDNPLLALPTSRIRRKS